MAVADWIGIDSSHLDSHTGDYSDPYDPYPNTLVRALNGIDFWGCYFLPMPYYFILDLNESYLISKVRGRSNVNGDPTNLSIYISDDKEEWGAAVATGITTWQDTSNWVEINVTNKKGRYVKVVIHASEWPAGFLYWGKNYPNSFKIFDVYGGIVHKDIGLRFYTGSSVIKIGCQDLDASHKLRIRKGGTTYGIELVATDDPQASAIRIYDGVAVKALPEVD